MQTKSKLCNKFIYISMISKYDDTIEFPRNSSKRISRVDFLNVF